MAILIPYANPIRFFSEDTEDFFYNNQKLWTYRKGYIQPYQYTDKPNCQFIIDYNDEEPLMYLIDLNGNVVSTWEITEIGAAYGGFSHQWCQEIGEDVTEDGIYFLRAKLPSVTGAVYFRSEPIEIKTSHEDSLLIQYRHDLNDYDCYFKYDHSGLYIANSYMQLRIVGGVKTDGEMPGGKVDLFQDITLDPVILNATPNVVYRHTFGDCSGIPNYMADKLNRIFCMAETLIDGVGYTRNEGAKMEAGTRDPQTNLSVWTMDLLKKENLFSTEYAPVTAETLEIDFLLDYSELLDVAIILNSYISGCTIDWGDGTPIETLGENNEHAYPSFTEVYTARIYGTLANITSLYVANEFQVSGIRGFVYTPNITLLQIYHNVIQAIDISALVNILNLNMSYNELHSIDLADNLLLQELWIANMHLSSVDVTMLTALEKLDVSNNDLTTLNVKYNTELTELYCSGEHRLEAISNLKYCTKLVTLDCSENYIDNLFLAYNLELIYLYAYDNELFTIDISSNSFLQVVRLDGNHFSYVDTSALSGLLNLNLARNELTSLDVSSNTALTGLDVHQNQLSGFDIEPLTLLLQLDISDNIFATLDVTANTALETIRVNGNPILNANMEAFFNTLPTPVAGDLYYTEPTDTPLSPSQKAIATGKNWTLHEVV